MFGRVGETDFDLRFQIFGIPVRVHPLFWLVGVFFVWQSTDDPQLKLLGVLLMFFSILIHELGHAIVIRRYGYPSEIVLHGMGGYATSTRFSTWRQVWVSFAGPLAGFIVWGIVRATLFLLMRYYQEPLHNDAVWYSIWILLFINGYWGLMNLLPIQPLDGGQIAQALFTRYMPRQGEVRALQLSILASGAVAAYSLSQMPDRRYLLFLFGYLCVQSIIRYNEIKGHRL
jgi:stage IV sporulation protein FB